MEVQSGMSTKKVWDSVQHYTVRCSKCSKWRLIPTKEKYEEIREMIVDQPFQCEKAREWRPNASCEDASDVEQDGSLRWAMDKPSIPQTPRGWQRIIRIRAEGGTKFADVYYIAPSNKRFRSMVELNEYINENPRYEQQGLRLSQFSFQPPVAWDENYLAKRRACSVSRATSAANPGTAAIVPYGNTSAQSGVPEAKFKAPAEN